jgi:predicted phage-related endonuclease
MMGLTSEQKERRRKYIGGSDANIIMGGDPEKIYRLWEIKTGRRDDDDLSDNLAVMMGHATEDFNAAWYEKKTGDTVTNRGGHRVHDAVKYSACSLDGICRDGSAVWEAKHVGGREDRETIVCRYMPQLHHNMFVCGLNMAVLSVFEGNSHWWSQEIAADPFYMEALCEAEEAFWKCVTGDRPPVDLPAPPSPPPFDSMRIVDMTGSNQWAASAADYLANETAAKAFEKARKELKGLVEVDVRRAYGHGICIERDQRGALRFREMKE